MALPRPPWRHCGVLQIEPTDFCNLTCPMCHPQQGFRSHLHGELAKGYLDVGRFEALIDGIAASDLRFDHLIFQWLGDPSLHPELFTLLAHALRKIPDRADYFRIDTNAVLLDHKRVDELLAACTAAPETTVLLVLSLDAVSRDTYRKVKGRDFFDRVQSQVEHLLRRRAGAGPCSLNLEFQFVLQKNNHHELGAFVSHWDGAVRRLGGGRGHDNIMIKRLSVGTGGPQQDKADSLFAEAVAREGLSPHRTDHIDLKMWEQTPWRDSSSDEPAPRPPCPGLWKTPVVRWDGQLMPCCADVDGRIPIGRVGDTSFADLWFGPRMQRYRRLHIEGRFDEMPVCGDCGGINFYSFGPDEVRAWLDHTGESDSWQVYAKRMGLTRG